MKRYIPLDSLIDNEAYARQDKRHREWEGASLIAFITPANLVKGSQKYEITGLSCLVYPDGSAKIEYGIDVDPVVARLSMDLLGKDYDDLIAIDNEGLLLDYSLDKNTMTIDSLGSYLINISYFTTSLTNKTGSLWAMRIISPCLPFCQASASGRGSPW